MRAWSALGRQCPLAPMRRRQGPALGCRSRCCRILPMWRLACLACDGPVLRARQLVGSPRSLTATVVVALVCRHTVTIREDLVAQSVPIRDAHRALSECWGGAYRCLVALRTFDCRCEPRRSTHRQQQRPADRYSGKITSRHFRYPAWRRPGGHHRCRRSGPRTASRWGCDRAPAAPHPDLEPERARSARRPRPWRRAR
jgi:hypothetical protein